jgi:phosphate transport system substrate-binding protein
MRRACVVAALLALAAGCDRAVPERENVVLSGSRSMVPLMRDVADRFMAARPDVRIDIEPTGGERALTDTRQGLADIGLLGRALRADEGGLRGHLLARDGLAPVVHRSNPVRALSSSQVAALYNRGVTNWKDLGGSDRPIRLVGQAEGHAARDVFVEHFHLNQNRITLDLTVGSSEQAVEAVAATPGAVAYTSIGAARGNQAVRLLPLSGAEPTLENVASGDYPLVRPLLLLTRERPPASAKAFLDFARSAAVHDLVRKHGFVPAAP